MTVVIFAAAMLCLSIPAAILAALVYNDMDARRAEQGTDRVNAR